MNRNKSEQILINAVLLYSTPEVMKISALFSGMTELLENAMSGFVNAISDQQVTIDLQSHFSDDLDELVNDVLNQISNQSDKIIADYSDLLKKIEQEGNLEPAFDCILHFNNKIPTLIPLDQPTQTKDLLAYLSFMDKDEEHSKALQDFLHCFRPIFEQMKKERQREAEEEKQNEQFWFDAARSNDVQKLDSLLRTNIDIDLENDNRRTALALAVEKNHLESANFLLSHAAKPIAFFSTDSPLIIAIENNHPAIVEIIIKHNHPSLHDFEWNNRLRNHITDEYVDIFRQAFTFKADDFDLRILAKEAIKSNSGKLLQLFFEFGLDVNDERSSTPLTFVAIEENQPDLLRTLLEHGANINALDWRGDSLLVKSIDTSSAEIIDLILEYGTKLSPENSNYYPQTMLLFKLAKAKDWSIGKCLQTGILDYTIYDHFGKNFLHYAVDHATHDDSKDALTLCKALIEELDVDINLLTEDGKNTALSLASSEAVFDYLLEQKPDLNLTFPDGDTLLQKIKGKFDGRAISKILLAGANPNSTIDGLPVLHRGIRDNEDYVSNLIKNGADVNILDRNGLNIIQKRIDQKASIEKHLLALAKGGADFSLKTNTGLPICHALCANYPPSLLKEIVNITDIDLHISDNNGNNAIMQATLARNIPTIVYLSESGVDVNQANKIGATPLLHAIYQDDVELVICLVRQCNADITIKVAGKNLKFIAMQLTSYDVLDFLRKHDTNP